ncbi:MAG: hypothetical protein AB7O67_23325 [Vicinamibacterales bacterium]
MYGIGEAIFRGVIAAILIAFLAGAGCVWIGSWAWTHRPWDVQVIERAKE